MFSSVQLEIACTEFSLVQLEKRLYCVQFSLACKAVVLSSVQLEKRLYCVQFSSARHKAVVLGSG